jgi:hypothetical protein
MRSAPPPAPKRYSPARSRTTPRHRDRAAGTSHGEGGCCAWSSARTSWLRPVAGSKRSRPPAVPTHTCRRSAAARAPACAPAACGAARQREAADLPGAQIDAGDEFGIGADPQRVLAFQRERVM